MFKPLEFLTRQNLHPVPLSYTKYEEAQSWHGKCNYLTETSPTEV